MKQIISCFLSKEFFFSEILTGDKSKSKILKKESEIDFYKYRKYCIYHSSLFKQQRPNKIP